MSQIGTVISQTQTPAAVNAPYDTANAFMVGLADWGPANTAVTIQSLAGAASVVGPRSATNTTIYDSLDVYFREGPQGSQTAFFSRVVGPAASAASLVVRDANASAALLVNAVFVGNYGNAIQVAITNNVSTYVITLTDTFGNTLATSPALTTRGGAVTWAQTVGFVNIFSITNDAGALPATLAATPLTGGTDDRTHVTLTNWTNALNGFPPTLGPGQVMAPGVSDWSTTGAVVGITAALEAHGLANNRVAIGDLPDGFAATTQTSNISTSYGSPSLGSLGFWAGNVSAPGVTPGTSRSIPPSPVIAALCARVDAQNNPNLAAAGQKFPPQYVTGSFTLVSGTTETYSPADQNTLNSAGINTFAARFGVFENFGFVSSILPATDVIYWQFNHQRLRMAITAAAQVVAEPYIFSQLDGQGSDIMHFTADLKNMLNGFWKVGALYGATGDGVAYSVNTGPSVNTPQSLQAGQLNAILNVSFSPFAQLIPIVINSVPITANVPAGSTSSASGATTGF